jgi:hypothetical protein
MVQVEYSHLIWHWATPCLDVGMELVDLISVRVSRISDIGNGLIQKIGQLNAGHLLQRAEMKQQ